MKAMIFSDLITMRRNLVQLLGVMAGVSVILAFSMKTLAPISACAAAMIPMMFIFSVAAYDEMNKWEGFRLTMPISRKSVVVGRYACTLLVVVVSLVVGVVFSLAITGIAALLVDGMGQNAQLSDLLLENNTLEMIVFSGAMGSVVVLVVASVTIPVFMRFGMTLASRVVPFVIVFLPAALSWLFGEGGPLSGMVPEGMRWLLDDGGFAVLVGVLGVISLILFGLSMLLSMRLYRVREL